jgi:hypothetical protein
MGQYSTSDNDGDALETKRFAYRAYQKHFSPGLNIL